ncbi:MAG: hypothetical protein ABIJ40_03585 [Bacteroidota bacterium]
MIIEKIEFKTDKEVRKYFRKNGIAKLKIHKQMSIDEYKVGEPIEKIFNIYTVKDGSLELISRIRAVSMKNRVFSKELYAINASDVIVATFPEDAYYIEAERDILHKPTGEKWPLCGTTEPCTGKWNGDPNCYFQLKCEHQIRE